MSIKAIIFDLDGTLVDSIHDIARCGNEALTSLGFPTHSVDTYKALVGDGLAGLARKALPTDKREEATITKLIDIYRTLYAAKWSATTRPYPGITKLLADISARGIKLAVLSNKSDDFTKMCVEQLLPARVFAEVRGESIGTPKKPDPQGALEVAATMEVGPGRCLFVGDSEIDLETARRAGMEFVAVDWGYRSRAELEEAGARRFISAPGELLQYVQD